MVLGSLEDEEDPEDEDHAVHETEEEHVERLHLLHEHLRSTAIDCDVMSYSDLTVMHQ